MSESHTIHFEHEKKDGYGSHYEYSRVFHFLVCSCGFRQEYYGDDYSKDKNQRWSVLQHRLNVLEKASGIDFKIDER